MKSISVNGNTRMVPEQLSELTPQELRWLMRHIIYGMDAGLMKLQFLCRYFRLPLRRINRLRQKITRAIDPIERALLQEHYLECNSKIFLLTEQFNFLLHDRTLLHNPMPVIRFPWWRFRKLLGPADELKNITIWEFALTERALSNFLATDREEYLDQMMAILYRRCSFRRRVASLFWHQTDLRVPFCDQVHIHPIRRIRNLPLEVKLLVSVFFASVVMSFKEPHRFPNVYHQQKEKQSPGTRELSWADVIMELSGPIPGKEASTAATNLYTFLHRLELNAVKLQKIRLIHTPETL